MTEIPQFVVIDIAAMKAELKAFYETETDRTIQPADIEQLIFNAITYREANIKAAIQSAALQNLVRFATFPILEYLGELVGVKRLGADTAKTRLQITLVSGHGDVVIPAGMRIATTDGQIIFTIDDNTPVATGTNTAIVNASADTEGVNANGYLAGNVSVILDPEAYISAAANLDTTAGGSDIETADQLRERIMLAPGSFNVAGPTEAYKYWTFTANAAIIDVYAYTPAPGEVNVYPLLPGGNATPQAVLDEVYAVINDEKIRPLTDYVRVLSPEPVAYAIAVDLILYEKADEPAAVTAVTALLETYRLNKMNKLGLDIVRSEITRLCKSVTDVYDVTVINPVDNLVLLGYQFGQCTSVTINVTGIAEG